MQADIHIMSVRKPRSPLNTFTNAYMFTQKQIAHADSHSIRELYFR